MPGPTRNYYTPGSDRSLWYTPDEAYDRSHLAGKVLLLTGPTAGLGAACIDEMCALDQSVRPTKIVLVGRSEAKLAVTAQQLQSHGIASSTYVADLMLPKQALRCCKEIIQNEKTLHVAMLNAGAYLVSTERKVQEDGLEEHYCVNFLQMAIFMNELASLLNKSATAQSKSRICVMGSYTTMAFSKGKLQMEFVGTKEGPHHSGGIMPAGDLSYSQSKLMQHIYCKHASVASKLPANVTVNVSCPGAAPSNTPGWSGLVHYRAYKGIIFPILSRILGVKLLSEGCATMMHLAGSKAMEGVTGKFCDFGYKYRSHELHRPVDMEIYPSEGRAIAESTADAALGEKLYEDTQKAIKRL